MSRPDRTYLYTAVHLPSGTTHARMARAETLAVFYEQIVRWNTAATAERPREWFYAPTGGAS